MKALLTTIAILTAGTAFAGSHEGPDADVVDKIMAKLAEMNCQMDADDIEMDDGGYDLDDVICEGGKQFDLKLDADLNETGRRAE